MEKKVKLTQIKSGIDRPLSQKQTLKSLRLGRIGKMSEFTLNPQVEGMIAKVSHLIKVEEL
ncbi:MAG: 50S ribosomal protein L30 [Bacteroidales bacterium]|nr:50S ribosomal protein L30 [Bacteroidales bacterium]MDE6631339.1 50S ribosomal protein L30 [Bacteroidales bacterium]MDE7101853.1 50S ribosomal protein L30 [Bacteroidales bacterium]MDE7338040.1 50S ribosomal protein L30 [Bacteroidales bacterium]MDE7356937.1 50S ribosomal protein L30 [Bacteroidales bacterium]